jgi:hypothetical protein
MPPPAAVTMPSWEASSASGDALAQSARGRETRIDRAARRDEIDAAVLFGLDLAEEQLDVTLVWRGIAVFTARVHESDGLDPARVIAEALAFHVRRFLA